MKTLDRDSLLTYLENAIELERHIYTQKQVMNQYESVCETQKPTLRIAAEPETPICKESKIGNTFWIVLGVSIFVAIMATVVAGNNPDNWWWDEPEYVHWKQSRIFWTTFWQLCWLPVIVIRKIMKIVTQRQYDQEWKVQYERVSKEKERIKKLNASSQENYNRDISNWSRSHTKGRNYLSSHLQKTQTALEKLYALDIVYSKYRTLPALTSIYEYIDSGRCSELTGPNGAYNLYEDELRKNLIITQLSVIIENLNSIRENQYLLYKEVQKIQKDVSNCSYQLSQIHGYVFELTELAKLNVYYNGVAARNSHIMAYWR